MKTKKLLFNGFIAFGFFAAIVCYFLPFFKLSGLLGEFDDALFGGMAKASMLDIFMYAIDLSGKDEQLVLFVFIILAAILPMFIGFFASILGFVLKPKFAGVVSILAAGYGVFTHVATRVILSLEVIDMGFFTENMVSLDEFVGYAPGGYLNLISFIICAILGLVMLLTCQDEEDVVVANSAPTPVGDYNNAPVYQDNNANYNYYNQEVAGGYYNNNVGGDYEDTPTARVNHYDYATQFNSMTGRIVGVAGQYRGADISIGDYEIIYIGRDPEKCNIIFDKKYVHIGRTHCSIQYFADKDKYKLTVYSSNGVVLRDGRRIGQGEKIMLSAGSRISLANQENVFDLK